MWKDSHTPVGLWWLEKWLNDLNLLPYFICLKEIKTKALERVSYISKKHKWYVSQYKQDSGGCALGISETYSSLIKRIISSPCNRWISIKIGGSYQFTIVLVSRPACGNLCYQSKAPLLLWVTITWWKKSLMYGMIWAIQRDGCCTSFSPHGGGW